MQLQILNNFNHNIEILFETNLVVSMGKYLKYWTTDTEQ